MTTFDLQTADSPGERRRSGSILQAADAVEAAVNGNSDARVQPEAAAPLELQADTRSGTARLAHNIAALGLGQMFTWTMTLAWTLVVPRIIGPTGYGTIVTAMSVTGILQIVLGMGTTTYVVREMVLDRNRASALLSTALLFRVVLAPLFLVGVVLWAHFARYGHTATTVLYLAGGATLLMMLAEPIQGAFQAIERMQYLAIADAINKSAQGLLGIALALAGLGAIGFAGCWMVMSGVVLILCIRWLRRLIRFQFRTSLRDVTEMARGSLAYFTGGLFFMVYLWIDTAMLSLMTDQGVVGWYGVATKLFQAMLFVPVLACTAWMPRLVSAFERSPDELRRSARAPIEILLAAALPIGTSIAVVADPLIRFLYGARFHGAAPSLIILGFCLVPMYLNMMFCVICIAAGRAMVWTRMMILATVFNPAVNAVLIPLTQRRYHNGAIGASVAMLLTELLIVACGIFVVGPGVFGRAAVLRLIRVTAACAGMLAVALSWRDLGGPLSVVAGFVTLAVLARLLRIVTAEEISYVQERIVAARARLPRPLRRFVPAPSGR